MHIKGNRSSSSRAWLHRQLNDPFVKQAKKDGYYSRAAFKLTEIDDKYFLIKHSKYIVDLGAAPGGWSQVLSQRSAEDANIISIDLLELPNIDKVSTIKGDFTHEEIQQEIIAQLNEKADLIVSDMAPSTIGHAQTDHLRIMRLAEDAFYFCENCLKDKGAFVIKIFQGGTEKRFVEMLKSHFKKVDFFKPKSSRNLSVEIYIVAIGFQKCI